MILESDAYLTAQESEEMEERKKRCTVCGKEVPGTDTICEACKARIRGEAVHQRDEIKKEADRTLHKEGTQIEKK